MHATNRATALQRPSQYSLINICPVRCRLRSTSVPDKINLRGGTSRHLFDVDKDVRGEMARSPFTQWVDAQHRFCCHFLSTISWHWLRPCAGRYFAVTCEPQNRPLPPCRSGEFNTDVTKKRRIALIWNVGEEWILKLLFYIYSYFFKMRMDIWVVTVWVEARKDPAFSFQIRYVEYLFTWPSQLESQLSASCLPKQQDTKWVTLRCFGRGTARFAFWEMHRVGWGNSQYWLKRPFLNLFLQRLIGRSFWTFYLI